MQKMKFASDYSFDKSILKSIFKQMEFNIFRINTMAQLIARIDCYIYNLKDKYFTLTLKVILKMKYSLLSDNSYLVY